MTLCLTRAFFTSSLAWPAAVRRDAQRLNFGGLRQALSRRTAALCLDRQRLSKNGLSEATKAGVFAWMVLLGADSDAQPNLIFSSQSMTCIVGV